MLNLLRPIRPSGWAFTLPASLSPYRPGIVLVMVLLLAFAWMDPVAGQSQADEHHTAHDGHHDSGTPAWEGSVAGIAYSEFNHHVAGVLLLVIGCAELSQALRATSPLWARLLLPAVLGFMGVFLLVWSDHEAWPIGSLSLSQTLYGGDHEILQHKLYGVLAVLVAAIEVLRRIGRLGHAAWMVPLPAFAIVGGWMLFNHSHGFHPSAQHIALHHAIMGTLAITAGSSKLVSAWTTGVSLPARSRWELLWAVLLLVIGLQLTLYSE